MYRLEFEVPELPLSVNRMNSMHWAQKGKYVKHWHACVAAAIGYRKPPKPLVVARLTMTRFGSREPDYDNLVGSFKPVTDALIVCGVLEDDKPSNIGESRYRWEKCKRKEARILVVVEEIESIRPYEVHL